MKKNQEGLDMMEVDVSGEDDITEFGWGQAPLAWTLMPTWL
jgi:hypothetical protein